MNPPSIPFTFMPIPQYFRKNGWLKDPNFCVYVLWAFGRCQTTSRNVFHDHKEINLAPFEYISGLCVCSKETGLTYRQIRTQQERLVKSGILKKSTSKTTNKFTVYTWVTDRFSESSDKQNAKEPTSNRQADDNKEEELEPKSSKNTPTPKSSKVSSSSFFYECLKEIQIPEKKKVELSSKYTELRVMHAVIFCQDPRCVIKTSLLRTLFWHCMQDEPPEHGEKPLAPEIMLAHEHNAIYEQHHPKAKAKNHTLIESERKMMIWEVEKFSPLNLNNPLETLKADFKKSKIEYAAWIKKQNENKIEKMEFSA